MPRYTFKLRDDDDGVEDGDGVNLPDSELAYRYACDVVRELMNCRELSTRHWQLDVYQDEREKVFEILFARLDPALDHLKPQLRGLIEQTCQRRRALRDVFNAATITVQEAKSLVTRSRGKPYLAADHGRKVIRDR